MRNDLEVIVKQYPHDWDVLRLYAIGDVHVGAENFDERAVRKKLDIFFFIVSLYEKNHPYNTTLHLFSYSHIVAVCERGPYTSHVFSVFCVLLSPKNTSNT